MKTLNRQVLVLNKFWTPVRIIDVKRALKLAFAEKASFIDVNNEYRLYRWEEWSSLPVDKGEGISTPCSDIKIPEVIVLLNYEKIHRRSMRLTKKNIFLRDGYICQYTGKPVKKSEADIDHVIPRSRGGRNTWDNMVVCMKELNRRKGDKTPEEAGLSLIKKPKEPLSTRFILDPREEVTKSWKPFLQDNK